MKMLPRLSSQAPTFFVLGAAKAGTTSLYRMLKTHPEIFMSRDKETQFFFNKTKYNKGLDFYLGTYFKNSENYLVRGEASPSYFHAPALVAPRMHETLGSGKLRFVVVLRDPVERAWSHYLHRVRVYAEKYSFEEALELEESRLAQDPTQWVGYYRDGLYGKLVSQWFTHFPREKFLFVSYEKLTRSWENVLSKICLHLGIDSKFDWPKPVTVNYSGVPRSRMFMKFIQKPRSSLSILKPILGEDRISRVRTKLNRLNTRAELKPVLDEGMERELRALYTPDIELLEALLERDFCHWKSPFGNRVANRIDNNISPLPR